MTLDLILTGVLQGLILALIAYAVMIPFRLLNLPDLTAEGAYPLGGALCAYALLEGIHPLGALFLGAISAGCLNMVTGIIYQRFKINTLLAGIILSTMAYSVNLRVIGKPNVALFETRSLFNVHHAWHLEGSILGLLGFVLVVGLSLVCFLKTEMGLRLRAMGLNSAFARRQGFSKTFYTLLGLALSGVLTGCAGGLIVQLQRYMDVGMGVGIVIHALAALMIGETMIGNEKLHQQLIAPLIGALFYQQIQGMVLSWGLAPSDLKFFTGSMVLIVIAVQKRTHTSVV